MGYAIFIVPEYIINVILPNERFFSTPIIRVVSSFVVLVLITFFELFTVSLTLSPEKNLFVILKKCAFSLKKALLRLILLKLAFFAVILVPGIVLFAIGSIFSQVIALILLILLPVTVLPIYAFCSNILIRKIYDNQC
jgi:hypothetical protein